jgi:phosphoglycolate phosphatase-like HAD superfamily hydrolase
MKAILFDIDGTLIHSGGAGGQALKDAMISEFGIEAPADVPVLGRTDRGIVRDLFAAHGIEHSDESWLRFVRAYLAHLPSRLPERQGRVLAGVAELLAELATREHLALGLLTGNTRDGARVKLEYFRLYQYFRFGGYGDLHFDRDDVAREAFGAARLHVGDVLTAERVVVIGDTPLDVRCARAIGAVAVAVCTGGHTRDELEASQPDLLLDDLSDCGRLNHLLT